MSSLGYATGGNGPFRPYIGWCDFTGLNLAPGTTLNYSTTIPGVGILSYNLNSPSSSSTNWQTVNSGGWLFGSAYTGVPGTPGTYALSPSTLITQTLNFNNIKLTDFSGNLLSNNYTIFVTQSEATISGEISSWITDGGNWIYWTTIPTSIINPTSVIVTGAGTNEIVETGLTPTPPQADWSTFLGSTQSPKNINLVVHCGGEGTTFGLIVNVINSNKQVNSGTAIVGDILTYTIPITNNSLDTLSNLTIVETLPSNVSFVSGSLTENGTSVADPVLPNINLSNITSFNSSTISFKVRVNSTTPSPILNSAYVYGNQGTYPNNTTTNTVVTTINYSALSLVKSLDKTTAVAGNILTYTIALSNTGNTTATNVILTDTLPATTTFVTGSVTGATGTPPTLTVGTIAPGRTSTVSFKVTIGTLPNNPILNDSTANYYYYANGGTTGTTIASSAISNTVSTSTASASITSIVKSTSENYGTIGDIITYTFNFTNTGNDTALGVTLIDTIPNGTTFVANCCTPFT